MVLKNTNEEMQSSQLLLLIEIRASQLALGNVLIEIAQLNESDKNYFVKQLNDEFNRYYKNIMDGFFLESGDITDILNQ